MDFSVVISTFNDCSRLAVAIDSVFRQTLLPSELIIVNDCSSDQTDKYLSQLTHDRISIVVLTNDYNLGLTRSLVKAIQHVSGSHVARLDSDDIWHTQKLEVQAAFFRAFPDIKLIATSSAKFPPN